MVDLIVRGSADMINAVEVAGGDVQNAETVSAAIRREYGDFIGGAARRVPVTNAKTRESIMNITDRAERLAAIQQNPHLFRN